MKASEFIGMKVLNQRAVEIGKIADLAMNLKECLVDQIIIVEGGTLNKKYYSITQNDLAEIGDYVQIKLDEEALNNISKTDKIEDLMGNEFHYKDLVGKTVLSEDAMTVGKIDDMIIEPKKCLIHEILVSTGGTFSKKHLKISDADIKHIGDYIVLKISKDELKEKIVD
ncbi:MAG TPA: PRC-barrel domain-containing protein [Methanobacterium sp.]|nr:PRC-barrel domain-containing protein [Methanobacterium sp.]